MRVMTDPLPDACSAVMCLCCGYYYCNYCFVGFNSGDGNKDRADAHVHVAEHKPVREDSGDTRDAFLPLEVTRRGQQKVQQHQLLQYLLRALSVDRSSNCISRANADPIDDGHTQHDLQLLLALCFTHIEEMGIDVCAAWRAAVAALQNDVQTVQKSGSGTDINAADDTEVADVTVEADDDAVVAAQRVGRQLAGALLTHNHHAAAALLAAQELDVNHIDGSHLTAAQRDRERRYYPLLSLAIVTQQDEIAEALLRRGADVTLGELKYGRTPLFIAIECGHEQLVRAILNSGRSIDLSAPITAEAAGYRALHVAAV